MYPNTTAFQGPAQGQSPLQQTLVQLWAKPSKNLSHVPCKFFRQGACQAGNSCPFSHSMDLHSPTTMNPCKYFQKGNCKFGLKCALVHVMADGRKVHTRAFAQYQKDQNQPVSSAAQIQHPGISHVDTQQIQIPSQTTKFGHSASSSISANNNIGSSNVSSPLISSFPHQATNQNHYFNNNQPQSGPASSEQQFLSYPNTWSQNSNHQTNEDHYPLNSSNELMDKIGNTYAGSNNIGSFGTIRTLQESNGFESSSHGVNEAAKANDTVSNLETKNEEAEENDDDDLKFEEDYVPSSLMDLLSSQELKRKIAKNENTDEVNNRINGSAFESNIISNDNTFNTNASNIIVGDGENTLAPGTPYPTHTHDSGFSNLTRQIHKNGSVSSTSLSMGSGSANNNNYVTTSNSNSISTSSSKIPLFSPTSSTGFSPVAELSSLSFNGSKNDVWGIGNGGFGGAANNSNSSNIVSNTNGLVNNGVNINSGEPRFSTRHASFGSLSKGTPLDSSSSFQPLPSQFLLHLYLLGLLNNPINLNGNGYNVDNNEINISRTLTNSSLSRGNSFGRDSRFGVWGVSNNTNNGGNINRGADDLVDRTSRWSVSE